MSIRPVESPQPRLELSIKELETFLVVAELGSFRGAAEVLSLSQPAVSARIQRLEATTGTQLLLRGPSGVEPTLHGEVLRERAQVIVRDLQLLLRDFKSEVSSTARRVTIAGSPMVSSLILPRLIGAYSKQNPTAQVRLRDLSADDAVAAVKEGLADFALLATPPEVPASLDFRAVGTDTMVVLCEMGHPLMGRTDVVMDDLVRYPFLILDNYGFLQKLMEAVHRERGKTFTPAYQVQNATTLLGMVTAGMGITMIPKALVPPEQIGRVGEIVPKDAVIHRTYGLISIAGRPMSREARRLLGFMQKELPSVLNRGPEV